MMDGQTNDHKTRDSLAYILTWWAIIALSYVLFRFGDRVEILTLIIGIISGTILGAVVGTYFAGQLTPKKPDAQIIQTGEQPTATTTPNEQ